MVNHESGFNKYFTVSYLLLFYLKSGLYKANSGRRKIFSQGRHLFYGVGAQRTLHSGVKMTALATIITQLCANSKLK